MIIDQMSQDFDEFYQFGTAYRLREELVDQLIPRGKARIRAVENPCSVHTNGSPKNIDLRLDRGDALSEGDDVVPPVSRNRIDETSDTRNQTGRSDCDLRPGERP